jgi:diaminohydroxyphosphoribosylaminopyrimidine deaminase/5-amino-6-(5-phosphoribosylamino)uracil reductase
MSHDVNKHESYMHRCVELAKQGEGYVAPNPMVGAVLVHDGDIIGEGFHKVYGGPHAEVNCIDDVKPDSKSLIPSSTLYVSLEPCAHYGKTPPCADLIIQNKIPRVVIGTRDPFPQVNGRGIEKLKASGIEVLCGILEKECVEVNTRFFTFHVQHRPYIILKWAETSDKKIGNYGNNRLLITNETTNRLVHKWRSAEAAIMVGTNTASMDDPQLTNRLWKGPNPVRIVIDKELTLPPSLRIYDGTVKTITFNLIKHEETGNLLYYHVTEDVSLVHQVVNGLYQQKILSVMIEGGAKLIQSFIDDDLWDEARVITNTSLIAGEGVAAPVLTNANLRMKEMIGTDQVSYFERR